MIVVTGAAGQLGSAFAEALGDRALLWDRTRLDLRRRDAIRPAVLAARPDLLINCAAYTAVDAAESDEATAHTVNATAVGELAAACSEVGAGFVTFSTDYVFDGTKPSPYLESDEPRPINVYGATKRAGEVLALERHPGALVVRTSWVMSGSPGNFATTMAARIPGGVRVVTDQRGRPTLAPDLAAATLAAVEKGVTGLLHLTNQGEASWYEVAREVAALIGADPGLVAPCPSDEFPRVARRPARSVLDSERAVGLGLALLPEWRDGLRLALTRLSRG